MLPALNPFNHISQVVFDKTGTLTTGKFTIAEFLILDKSIGEEEFKRIVYSLEKYSTHPIAHSISEHWKTTKDIRWKKIEEIKGQGMKGTDKDGREYFAGSYKAAAHLTSDKDHNVYMLIDHKLAGWINVKDETRPEAKAVVSYLHRKVSKPSY